MIATALLRRAEAAHDSYVRDLSELVCIDSGSDDPAGVNRVADWVEQRLARLGFSPARTTESVLYGDVLIGRRRGSGSKRILLFAHMDTVFMRGEAAKRPFSIDPLGIAHGPGVSDDKAGVVAALHAAEHLIDSGLENFAELILMFTPDEEIGSPVGGPALQRVAGDADVAFCLECARENGDLVVARKGAIDLRIEVYGIAAHSGIEPERGAHAGLEAAHLTVFLQSIADPLRRLTVNVGLLRAGDRTNIVPDRATLDVEIRAAETSVLDEVVQQLQTRALSPLVEGTRVEVHLIDHCPPLEETDASRALADSALRIAAELDFQPGLARTGGVSDANRVAALGIPTLDGLGPIGGADHTSEEWLDLRSAPTRIALLATLINESATS